MSENPDGKNEIKRILSPQEQERDRYIARGMSPQAANLRSGLDTSTQTPGKADSIPVTDNTRSTLRMRPGSTITFKGRELDQLGGWAGKGTSKDVLEPYRPEFDNLGSGYIDPNAPRNPIDPRNLGPSYREANQPYNREILNNEAPKRRRQPNGS